MRVARAVAVAMACALALVLGGCSLNWIVDGPDGGSQGSEQGTTSSTDSSRQQDFKPSSGSTKTTIKIASGSENREAAEAIQKAVDESGVAVHIDYMGSLDIMDELENGGGDYDAVWPASSIWISLGDTKHLVKDEQSTSTTPVVFGVAKKKAVELGWSDASGKTRDVSTADVLAAVEAGKLTFSMTSATQSNSGASAYLAFLAALKGGDSALTADDLKSTALTDQVKSLLQGVDRSSGSSDWLKDLIVADPGAHDAMVNYESLVIAANKQLEQAGNEPLVAVYPSDGIAVSDSPLGFVDRGQGGDAESAFKDFQKALASDDAKLLLERAGRRTGLGGAIKNADDKQVKEAFRADWGIRTDASALKAVPMPTAAVIEQALTVYQTALRKPSWTVWVVDYSGSMQGAGKDGVVDGLTAALDPTEAEKSMIQPTDDDVNVFIPFSGSPDAPQVTMGSDTQDVLSRAKSQDASGGTDIYAGLESALDAIPSALDLGSGHGASDYTVAIVLMTDGVSDTSNRDAFYQEYGQRGDGVPVYPIMFGQADPTQLNDIAKKTGGKVFDGRSGSLADVFRQVKGYN